MPSDFSPVDELPRSGMLEAGCHRFPLRVYYEDTDNAQIVFYANYLKFTERARTEYLRLLGLEQSDFGKRYGLFFAVKDCFLKFVRPAYLDDLLEVRTRIVSLKAASLAMEQVIFRGEQELVRCDITIACLSDEGRPVRMPEELRTAFEGARR